MEIHYKKVISIGFIVFGALSALLYFVLDAKNLVQIGFSLFLIFYGYLTLTKPYFILNDNSLELHAILGPAMKSYTFDSFQDFQVENNKIYLNQKGNREKLPISKWMVENQDWQLLIDKINA